MYSDAIGTDCLQSAVNNELKVIVKSLCQKGVALDTRNSIGVTALWQSLSIYNEISDILVGLLTTYYTDCNHSKQMHTHNISDNIAPGSFHDTHDISKLNCRECSWGSAQLKGPSQWKGYIFGAPPQCQGWVKISKQWWTPAWKAMNTVLQVSSCIVQHYHQLP